MAIAGTAAERLRGKSRRSWGGKINGLMAPAKLASKANFDQS
jgi:hypothetical protein